MSKLELNDFLLIKKENENDKLIVNIVKIKDTYVEVEYNHKYLKLYFNKDGNLYIPNRDEEGIEIRKINTHIFELPKIPNLSNLNSSDKKLLKSKDTCEPLASSQMSWGSILDELRTTKLSGSIYQTAFNLKLPIITDQGLMCDLVKREIPDIDWQFKQLNYFANLSEEEKYSVNYYIDYGFSSINRSLRTHPILSKNNHSYNIQNAINSSFPTVNNFVVYRKIPIKFIPQSTISKNYGFVSTTIDINLIAGDVFKNKETLCILKFYVSSKSHCLYIPSQEAELIFPHESTFEIINELREQYYLIEVKGEYQYVKLKTMDIKLS